MSQVPEMSIAMNAAPTKGFRGIYPILYAFFDAAGRLDQRAMRLQIAACVAAPCHGIAALGLATEADKLTSAEKRNIIVWLAEQTAGCKPLAITISGATVDEYVELAQFAAEHGAGWLVLQPPRDRTQPEQFYFDFFASVMARVALPCAIQNAPEYLGVGLSPQSIARLAQQCANFILLKGEGPAVKMHEVIACNPGMAVFNGRGGLELIDNLRAGCAGMIIGAESFDWQTRVFDAFEAGDVAKAQRLYETILPGIVFMMQSIDHLVCYGKQIAAARLGIGPVYQRLPALRPNEFGSAAALRFTAVLGTLPQAAE